MLSPEHRREVAGVVVSPVPINVMDHEAPRQELVVGEFPNERSLRNPTLLTDVRMLGAVHVSTFAAPPVVVLIATKASTDLGASINGARFATLSVANPGAMLNRLPITLHT